MIIHRSRHTAVLLGPLTILLAVGSACSSPGSGDGGIAEALYAPTVAAVTAQVGVCLDGSDSNDQTQVIAGVDVFADFVRAATATDGGVDARVPADGLDVAVRKVSVSSFSSGADELLRETVPAVPGLLARPDPAEYQTYAERNGSWKAAAAGVEASSLEAAAAQERLLTALGSIDVASGGSEIAGCVTALRDSFPAREPLVAVVVSDLEQVGSPQIRGDYGHVNVIVAHTCPTVERCDATEAEWRPVFDAMGVASATFVPIGQLGNELARLIGGSS